MKYALTALALVLAVPALAAPAPANLAAGLKDSRRSAEDVARDAARKPAEMVAFAEIRPGQHVVDFLPGTGYFTRIFAGAVGPNGMVEAVVPASTAAKVPKYKVAAEAAAADYDNVKASIPTPGTIAAPGSADLVWTAQNYHDIHNIPIPQAVASVNRAAFDALKPGGLYVVIDHSDRDGSDVTGTNTLHRIDEAVVKSEVMAAGFVLDGESNTLRNAADPRTANVFDPAIKGHTDQFMLRFRKPK